MTKKNIVEKISNIESNVLIDDVVKKELIKNADSLPERMIPEKKDHELFYYTIKGRNMDSGWSWPPLYSEFMFAKNSKELRENVNKEFLCKFPARVTGENNSSFLITVSKISNENRNTNLIERSVFRKCLLCKNDYRIIDIYNEGRTDSPCSKYCCWTCRKNDDQTSLSQDDILNIRRTTPIIYRIYNKETKMSYVGKTTKVFTYRLYQHFFQKKKTKLSTAIFSSKLTEWEIFIIEEISPEKEESYSETSKRVSKREQYWINHYDSIENGYNMINSTLDDESPNDGESENLSEPVF